ncbi:hypothetical protein SRHO_G00290980 [Serrasalmus rhombeus]
MQSLWPLPQLSANQSGLIATWHMVRDKLSALDFVDASVLWGQQRERRVSLLCSWHRTDLALIGESIGVVVARVSACLGMARVEDGEVRGEQASVLLWGTAWPALCSCGELIKLWKARLWANYMGHVSVPLVSVGVYWLSGDLAERAVIMNTLCVGRVTTHHPTVTGQASTPRSNASGRQGE